MNSVQVQCQFITLHYLRQLTSWVQLLKKREIISALVHLDSPPPAPNKRSEGKKALSNLKSQNASLCESIALVQQTSLSTTAAQYRLPERAERELRKYDLSKAVFLECTVVLSL